MDVGVCGVNGCFKNTALFLRNHVARGEDSSYLHTSVGAGALASASAGTLGVIAQLVERLNGIEEVWGSNPHGSTKRSSFMERGSIGLGTFHGMSLMKGW